MNPWTVLGCGAIGGLIACQLQQAGVPIQLLPRKPQASHTISLISNGRESRYQFAVAGETPVEQLILATKTYQSEAAVDAVRDRLSDSAIIIVLQNGMGTADWLQSQLPNAIVMGATTTHGAYRESPERIVHAGAGTTWLGPLQSAHRSMAQSVYQQWADLNAPVEWDPNILQRLWLKLAINCAINPLTVIFDCRNGELLQIPAALNMMDAIVAEFVQVYNAAFGVQPPQDVLITVKQVAENTANNISSMRQDILQGQPTEIGAINAYLVAQGKQLGIACPSNEAVIQQVREREPNSSDSASQSV